MPADRSEIRRNWPATAPTKSPVDDRERNATLVPVVFGVVPLLLVLFDIFAD
jgi:hypothetical protein